MLTDEPTAAPSRLTEIDTELAKHAGAMVAAMRTTVTAAWHVGRLLLEAKELVGHGAWVPWLRERGIEERQAQRFTRVAREYTLEAVEELGSVDAALRAIAAPAKATSSSDLPLRHQLDAKLGELAAVRKQEIELQHQVDDADRRIKLLMDDARPDAAARQQELTGVQAEHDTLVAQVQRWQQRIEEEQRRSAFYERLARQHRIALGSPA